MAGKRRKHRKHRLKWSSAHVRRLFWRAGFGATPDEVARWRKRGRRATIDWLVGGDGAAQLDGPEPSADGKPLDPVNEYGHDVLWWLDRMVRTTRPLEEKLTLFWHDHFATREQDTPLMLAQNRTLREHALGDFPSLLNAVTVDPAMQLFLNLAGSTKEAPNENYARELMELFTLGAGYGEDDSREAARALTGWKAVVSNGRVTGVTYDPARHDDGTKTIFGRTGAYKWDDVLALCLEHPEHPSFIVSKLWSFFVGTPMRTSTRRKLVALYRSSGMQIAPVVRRILDHPDLYANLDKPDMIKWPVVFLAGQLRALGVGVQRQAWEYLTASMGQRLFAPPSVAGWDWGAAWMSTNAMRVRLAVAAELVKAGGPAEVRKGTIDPVFSGDGPLDTAKVAVGRPQVTNSTDLALRRLIGTFAAAPEASASSETTRRNHAESMQRALRHLLIAGPDNQLC